MSKLENSLKQEMAENITVEKRRRDSVTMFWTAAPTKTSKLKRNN